MSTYPSQAPLPPPKPSSTLAIISLIAGILGFIQVLPLIGALAAVITGHMAKNEIRQSNGQLGGDGMATAGLILGYIPLVLSVLCLCAFGIMLALGVSIPVLDSFNY